VVAVLIFFFGCSCPERFLSLKSRKPGEILSEFFYQKVGNFFIKSRKPVSKTGPVRCHLLDPPKKIGPGWCHLCPAPKNPGPGWCHLLDPPKNPGSVWCHLGPTGDRDRRPGPDPVASPVNFYVRARSMVNGTGFRINRSIFNVSRGSLRRGGIKLKLSLP
jgi:hypothetical protein